MPIIYELPEAADAQPELPITENPQPNRNDRIQPLEIEIADLRKELDEVKEVLQGLVSAFENSV